MDLEAISLIQIHQFSTSNAKQQYVACFEKRYFEISNAVARLIVILQESRTMDEACERYAIQKGCHVSQDEMGALIKRCIIPIIHPTVSTKSKRTFLFSIELLNVKSVGHFSNIGKFLFNKWIMLMLIIFSIGLEIIFLSQDLTVYNISQVNIYTLIGIFSLLLFSSFIHELGHASACRHYGIQHGSVGFGLYLNFPVFYTDVSGIWRLPRLQRLIVNMAGIYFQLILLIPLLLFYFNSYDNTLKYSLLVININFLITLNPFFKFDGYWIISDVLGVPNLRERTKEFITYLTKKIRHQPIAQNPYLLQIKKRERYFVILYACTVNIFFLYYFIFVIPVFLVHFWETTPALIKQTVINLASGTNPDFESIKTLLGQLIFFSLTVYVILRMVKMQLKRIYRNKSASENETITPQN